MEANIQALKAEALEKRKEYIRLSIKRNELKIGLISKVIEVEKDKEEVEGLKKKIKWYKTDIEDMTKELQELESLTPEQYAEKYAAEVIGSTTHTIENCTASMKDEVIKEYAEEEAVSIVRHEIEEAIERGEIKAPKSYDRAEKFIDELLASPEYAAKLAEVAKSEAEKRRNKLTERINNAREKQAQANPNSAEFLIDHNDGYKSAIVGVKGSISELDLLEVFKYNSGKKDIRREAHIGGINRNVLEVVAQIPPEEYIDKIRPILEGKVADAVQKYTHDEKQRKFKELRINLKAMTTYMTTALTTTLAAGLVGGMIDSMSVTEPGVPIFIGLGGGFVAGITAGLVTASKVAKANEEKLSELAISADFDDYIEAEVKSVLVEQGYIKEEEKNENQPGQK